MLSLWRVLESMIKPANCSELPPPPADLGDELDEDAKEKEEPIIFDESESPMLA